MTNKQFDTRTNSISDYLQYLMALAPIKFEQVTTGEATMAEYNQLNLIIADLVEVLNEKTIQSYEQSYPIGFNHKKEIKFAY